MFRSNSVVAASALLSTSFRPKITFFRIIVNTSGIYEFTPPSLDTSHQMYISFICGLFTSYLYNGLASINPYIIFHLLSIHVDAFKFYVTLLFYKY